MMRKPPRYCHGFVDRHGKPRWYLRRRGFDRVPLPGLPWSPEFMAAYQAALSDQPRAQIGASRTKPGTIAALVAAYYGSGEFKALAPSTQATYRNIIDRFRDQHAERRVAKIERRHVRAMLDKRSDTPAAAKNFLRMLRMLMRYAIDLEMRKDDPTIGVRAARYKIKGFTTWSEDDITAFEEAHPIGSRARLALALLLYTGQRRSDVVRMGRQHVRGGFLRVVQQKTGTELEIPMHARMRAVLDATPATNLTYLVTAFGKPFSPAGFTNWFHECCVEAGLRVGLSPHGLRKAISRRLAEAGCTPHQIKAITGHKGLDEVSLYTEAAGQKRLAAAAMDQVETAFGGSKKGTTSG